MTVKCNLTLKLRKSYEVWIYFLSLTRPRGSTPDFKWQWWSNGGQKSKPQKNPLGFKKKKITGPEFIPQKSHAEFPNHNEHFQEPENDITRKIERLVLNTQDRVSVLQTSKEFRVFLFRQSSSGPLRKHIFTCDWCISIHFVCFCVLRFVACDRPVSGNNRLVFFEDFSDHSLFLSLALDKKSTHHRDFLRYSWAVWSHSQFCFCRPS